MSVVPAVPLAGPALTFHHHEKVRDTGYESLVLSPAHAKEWTLTKAAFHYHCPAFTHLLSTMMNPNNDLGLAIFVEVLPSGEPLYCAATDGVALLINPTTFFALPLLQRVFVVAHEVLHNLFDHIGQAWRMKRRGFVIYPDGTQLPYHDEAMNAAEDCVINAILIHSQVGEFNTCWLIDPRVPHTMTAIDAYRMQFKSPPPAPPGLEKAKKAGKAVPARFDTHLPPGQGSKVRPNPDEVAARRSDSEWKTAAAAAEKVGQQMGKLPAFLSRLFGEMLAPRVDWREHITGFLHRKAGGGGYDWQRPDRRYLVRSQPIVIPGRSGFGCGTVVVASDTSGSIGGKTLTMFMSETAGILEEMKPRRLIALWCDAEVHNAEEIEDIGDLHRIRHTGVKGGGGTSFVPVFDWLVRNDVVPDCLVYLTDMHGTFPRQVPPYAVLWASIAGTHAPFGDLVMIPVQKET